MSSPLGVTPLAASALHTRCEVVLKAVALMDLDDATAGIFANLIVWCALHREYTLHEDLQ